MVALPLSQRWPGRSFLSHSFPRVESMLNFLVRFVALVIIYLLAVHVGIPLFIELVEELGT